MTGVSGGNEMDPVVQQLFGFDVRFSAKQGKFWSLVPNGSVVKRRNVDGTIDEHVGKTRLEAKTIDEMEKLISETFVPTSSVEVMQWNALRSYEGVDGLRVPEPLMVKGFNVEKTRGRYAQKVVTYKTDKGQLQINSTLYKRDDNLIAEIKALREEHKALVAQMTLRAKALALKFESLKVTPEEVLRGLSLSENSVSNESSPINLDVYRDAFKSDGE